MARWTAPPPAASPAAEGPSPARRPRTARRPCADSWPAAGASSYTIYDGGIEIEIDTRPDQRRQGLALACGAQLILTCLERRLFPNWDAHDLRSAALAEKLGYRMDHPYRAYLPDRSP